MERTFESGKIGERSNRIAEEVIPLDEYLVLNTLFLVVFTIFAYRYYILLENVVKHLEIEMSKTQYAVKNPPPMEIPDINIPPPPPPIPDEWFERMEEHLSKVPEIDLSDIEGKINAMSKEQIKIQKLDKFFTWNEGRQEWIRR